MDATTRWVREKLERVATRVKGDLGELFAESKRKNRHLRLSETDLEFTARLVREVAEHATAEAPPAIERSLADMGKLPGAPVNMYAFGGHLADLLDSAADRVFPFEPSLAYRLRFRRPGQGSRRPARFVVDLCHPDGASLFDDRPLLAELVGGSRGQKDDDRRDRDRLPFRDHDFLAHVEAVCRIKLSVKTPEALVERVPNPAGTGEHLRVSEPRGEIVRFYPIGAVATISPEALRRFADDVDAAYRRNDSGLISVLVYGGPAAPEELKLEATRRRIDLPSFLEYQGLFDLEPYLQWQTRRLLSDRRYSPATYIPQRMRCGGLSAAESSHAALTLVEWLRSPGAQFLLILGDFGTGKSFLLREVTRRLTAEKGIPPILVELRDLEKARTLEELIAQHFARTGMPVIPLKAFRYMLEHGRVALLFDGFDELVLRSSYARAAEHFETILQAAGGEAKVVVTSRTQFFRSDADVAAAMRATAIGHRLEQVVGRRICDLQPFDPVQIVAYLSKRFQDAQAAEAFFDSLGEALAALASNPRMLSFIADIPSEELRTALDAKDPKLADIYEKLIQRWLAAEYERVQPRGALDALTIPERWEAVRSLAVRLWHRGETWIEISDLTGIAAELVGALAGRQFEPEQTAFQVGSGTLLVRDEAGRFAFIHPSVMEWLVASDAAESIRSGRSPDVLAAREFSSLMILFLVQRLGHDEAVAWSSETLGAPRPNEIAKTNALLILQKLGERRASGANLVRQNLSGHDLSGQALVDADLTGATLSGAALGRAVLSEARLLRADATGADFTDATLTGADLRNATFTSARFYDADLRGAKAAGASFRRCKLLGARTDGVLEPADTRGAAFSLPDELDVVLPVSMYVRKLALTPDGELLLAAAGSVVRVWDVAAGVELRRLRGHDDWVRDVSVHPQGHICASASDDRTIRLWSLDTGEPIRELSGHGKFVHRVAFHPGGEFLISGAEDGNVRIWNADTGETLHVLEAHQKEIRALALTSDGGHFVTGSDDRHVACWSFETRQLVRRSRAFDAEVTAAAVRPGGMLLAAVATANGQVWLWDIGKDELLLLGTHGGKVGGVAFSRDGSQLASVSQDETARVWSVETATEIRRFQHDHRLSSAVFSPLGDQLITGADGGSVPVGFWDLTRAYQTRVFRDASGFSPRVDIHGDRLAVTGVGDRSTAIWDLRVGREVARLTDHRLSLGLVFSTDGRAIALGGLNPPALWDVASATRDKVIDDGETTIWDIAFSPDGTQVAYPHEHDVRIRRVTDNELIAELSGHTDTIWRLAYAPDGSLLASGSSDDTTRLWYLREGGRSLTLPPGKVPIRDLAFSPDGSVLIATGHRLQLWDVRAEALIDSPLQGMVGRSVAFSPDGTSIAVGDFGGRIRIFRLSTGEELYSLGRHEASVNRLLFLDAGRKIISAAEDDHGVRLWDVSSGRLLAAFCSLAEGWIAHDGRGRYKSSGSVQGHFWHVVNFCRFEAGELLRYRPELELGIDEPLYDLD